MRVSYIVALLMIVLIVGCAAPETPPAAPAEEAPPVDVPAAPAEEAPPAADVPAAQVEEPAEEETELSDADKAHIDRLKPACERGSIQSCLVLKNSYGIDWPPEVVEEPETTEEPEAVEEVAE